MKSVHVRIDDDLFHEIENILPFHGGVSHAVRIALKNFVRDIKDGKISVSNSQGESNDNEGDRS